MEQLSVIITDIFNGAGNALAFVFNGILGGSPYIITFVLVFLVIGLGSLARDNN